jgi:hypothetical protein
VQRDTQEKQRTFLLTLLQHYQHNFEKLQNILLKLDIRASVSYFSYDQYEKLWENEFSGLFKLFLYTNNALLNEYIRPLHKEDIAQTIDQVHRVIESYGYAALSERVEPRKLWIIDGLYEYLLCCMKGTSFERRFKIPKHLVANVKLEILLWMIDPKRIRELSKINPS